MERVSTEISDPAELHEVLVNARHVSDQLELALVHALRIASETKANLLYTEAVIEDAEVGVIDQVQKKAYASAKEKSVDFTRLTLEQRRDKRIAQETHNQAEHTVEVLRILLRGVDSTRREIEVRLRAVTLTSSLERG